VKYMCHGHIVDRWDTYEDDDMEVMYKEGVAYFRKYFTFN